MLSPWLLFMGLYTGKGIANLSKERNEKQILPLLEAIWLPKRLANVLCKGHQKEESPEARGNRAAGVAI